MTSHNEKCMPKRIILVRHGESQGNRDGTAYTTTPDYKIPLTPLGIQQSKSAGENIRRVVSDNDRQFNWKVYFYVSPYERTRATLREIGKSFCRKSVIGGREEVRIREQDFGNFQESERMKAIKKTRMRYGRFFYRFPEGESAADVFDRVSGKINLLVFKLSYCNSIIRLLLFNVDCLIFVHILLLETVMFLFCSLVTYMFDITASLPF